MPKKGSGRPLHKMYYDYILGTHFFMVIVTGILASYLHSCKPRWNAFSLAVVVKNTLELTHIDERKL